MGSEHVRREVYQFTVLGHLDREWSDWFDGLTITLVDNGETLLTGPVVDQTALHGILIKIRDLGLPLLALTRLETGGEHEWTAPLRPDNERSQLLQNVVDSSDYKEKD